MLTEQNSDKSVLGMNISLKNLFKQPAFKYIFLYSQKGT
jgi:hypothetical protein